MARKLTEAEIEAGKTAKGGFTRKQLAEWGVPWPPPSGWKKALLTGRPFGEAPVSEHEEFIHSTDGVLLSPIRRHVAAHDLLRQVCVAVIEAGHASDLYRFPDVLRYFGADPDARPTVHDTGWIKKDV
jgi:hypothetical protein